MTVRFAPAAPYEDVGLDPFLSPHDPLRALTSDHRGPHQNREFNLMALGRKPLAMVTLSDYHVFWEPILVLFRWRSQIVELTRSGKHNWLVAPSEQTWRFAHVQRVYARIRARGHMIDADHARLGILFGYSREDIRAFLAPPLTRLPPAVRIALRA